MKNQKLFVLVIESKLRSLKQTIKLLQKNSLVSEIESAANTDQAIPKIINFSPDIILFEYPPVGNSGNELLKFIQAKLTGTFIIFVSETTDYAATAIRNGIYNYLIKPISPEELDQIIRKVYLIKQTNSQSRINEIIEKTSAENKLKFQTTRGYLIIGPEDILYCKADGLCSYLYLTNDRVEHSFLSISKVEEILRQFNFLRINRSHLINQKYIRRILRSTYSVILVADGKEYEVKGSIQQIKNLSNFEVE